MSETYEKFSVITADGESMYLRVGERNIGETIEDDETGEKLTVRQVLGTIDLPDTMTAEEFDEWVVPFKNLPESVRDEIHECATAFVLG